METNCYVDFFKIQLLENLQFWQSHLQQKDFSVRVFPHRRAQILRCISFSLNWISTWQKGVAFINEFAPHLERSGQWEHWEELLERGLSLASQHEDVQSEIILRVALARFTHRQGRFDETVHHYWCTISLARRVGDDENEARACSNLAALYTDRGRWWRAEILCRYALKKFHLLENLHGLAHTENHLGLLYTRQKRWDIAQYHLEQACMWWRKKRSGDLLWGLLHLGMLYLERGQPDTSLDYSQQALLYAQTRSEKLAEGLIYMNMGLAYSRKKNFAQAETYLWQAEQVFREIHDQFRLAQVQGNLGHIYQAQKKWKLANLFFRKSLRIWRQLDDRYRQIKTHLDLVALALKQADGRMAARRLSTATQLLPDEYQHHRFQKLHQLCHHYMLRVRQNYPT